MPQPVPDPVRNRRGCFFILAILALFAALYLYAGFSADPGNEAAEDIQAIPAGS